MKSRHNLLRAAAMVALATLASVAFAQYPSKTIRVLVGFLPGPGRTSPHESSRNSFRKR